MLSRSFTVGFVGTAGHKYFVRLLPSFTAVAIVVAAITLIVYLQVKVTEENLLGVQSLL